MTDHTDPRTDEVKREMAQHFAENESDYRDADWATIIYEDDNVVLVEDAKGYEFGEWSEEFDLFSMMMHERANQLCDHRWDSTYPLVFDKLEDDND